MARHRRLSHERDVDRKTQTKRIDDFDSSDEEDLRNTIGNIPIWWYEDCPHFGYDKDGTAIAKAINKDQMEAFIEKMDDPDYWRKVFDRQSGGFTTLSDEQVSKLEAIGSSQYPDSGYNPYEPFVDLFSSQTEIHPISNRPESKQAFIPSRDEKRLVGRMVYAIKMGWAKPPRPPRAPPKVYDLWAESPATSKTKSEQARIRMHFPAPKVALPSNAESYNPPAEYLFDDEELRKWMESDPEERRINFVPQKFNSLRKVPAYDRFFNERYERCLDLYLAPRQRRMRLNVDPSQLLPELPSPADLRPFPTTLAFHLRGHEGQVQSLSFEPDVGELLASGGADATVRIWSIGSGRCLKTTKMDGAVRSVAMCPLSGLTLVAAVFEPKQVIVMNTHCGDRHKINSTAQFLAGLDTEQFSAEHSLKWMKHPNVHSVIIHLPNDANRVVWHAKGDYFATFASINSPNAIYVHQLSKCKSQAPFSKVKGIITGVLFHPREPLLFVATRQYVRIYDLIKCQLKKKLLSGSRWLSCMQIDLHGENLFVGGLDRTFSWIDLQLSNKPWKTARHHSAAIRSITYHSRYPLLATVSDDATAIVYYAKVSVDLFKENELIPVRRLRTHTMQSNGLSILDAVFHPLEPWLVTAGADGLIALFTY
uniref:Ribosome biogenesis protein BOP1 homolog n=1 Tax=Parascaris univalens TaxID=6257 RepID=A0A915BS73_PARUN